MKNTAEKLLVVIDMQKDFIDGSLGTPEAQVIVPKVKSLMSRYAMENIYATKDTHHADYLSTSEGHSLPVEHCIKGTPGWEFDAALSDLHDAIVMEKPTFGSETLVERLKERNAQSPVEIGLAGLCTDICVVSNALLLKAAMPEVSITVYEDCCAGVTVESHEAALLTMKMCQIQMERLENQ